MSITFVLKNGGVGAVGVSTPTPPPSCVKKLIRVHILVCFTLMTTGLRPLFSYSAISFVLYRKNGLHHNRHPVANILSKSVYHL
jgi:hypothetical protein